MRVKTTKEHRDLALQLVERTLENRMKQKGDLSFNSPHEIVGWLTEEVYEFQREAQDADKHHKEFAKNCLIQELIDIAVVAVFGIASIAADGLEYY